MVTMSGMNAGRTLKIRKKMGRIKTTITTTVVGNYDFYFIGLEKGCD
jgi:hypothetical protein